MKSNLTYLIDGLIIAALVTGIVAGVEQYNFYRSQPRHCTELTQPKS